MLLFRKLVYFAGWIKYYGEITIEHAQTAPVEAGIFECTVVSCGTMVVRWAMVMLIGLLCTVGRDGRRPEPAEELLDRSLLSPCRISPSCMNRSLQFYF